MCKKRSSVKGIVTIHGVAKWIRIDPCIKHLPLSLSMHGFEPVACCCGHGRYPMTVICKVHDKNRYFDLISGKDVKRKEGGGWYLKDKDGYYFIPEVIDKNG